MEGSVKNKNQKYFQPWLWAKAKPPMNIFPNGFAFAHCHTKGFVFFTVPECLARLFARGHKQKVLAHRFYLVPGFAGKVCAVAAFVVPLQCNG
jgi:hypothetical protein